MQLEDILTSSAEKAAEKAELLNAFSGLKLLHIKKQLVKILSLIGREGIFDEYTKHDITHIDFMLDSLDWIIPTDTKKLMTSADWLMIVLAVYFHDLGMLVTKDEYKNRNDSDFINFKKSIEEGKLGIEFKDRIERLPDDKKERFLYQEFVRKTHAERIKLWILNEDNQKQVKSLTIAKEIKKLIEPIDSLFKRDLAIICESHHLEDLDNFEKYKINQPYGNTKDETVNLQYIALILRTADLLHITSDRTPSIEFNLINPSDPISQEEWCKQKAVKSIRPKLKKNIDDVIDKTIPQDTIEVTAYFEDSGGFFGLISYLNYAEKQLKKSFELNKLSKRLNGDIYEFPWKRIEDENIETKDFEKRQFEFILDQPKILDLLVGHTLYNDSTVVLRELSQNSLDAVRLQKYIYSQKCDKYKFEPEVIVNWDSKEKKLVFTDNGTGMNLEIIQNHLLKVGSSRYQDENFIKKYPDFSPISRYGIGLLTCFLIANDIDIITKSYESDKAIKLCIRKIHGKYLLKYLPIEEIDSRIRKHGSEIKLFVRPDIKLDDIENDLKKWVLFPNCSFKLIKNENTVPIGYLSPKDIINDYLSKNGFIIDDNTMNIKELSNDGIEMAYAVKYNEYFKEWSFLTNNISNSQINLPIGTCIEGIRVEFDSPGFSGKNLVSIINTTGNNAPKTNVARSNIKNTQEKETLIYNIYKLYLKHISDELHNLFNEKGFSISWATREANYMINEFVDKRRFSTSKNISALIAEDIFVKAISDVKCILIESQIEKRNISINELIQIGSFWTINSALFSSADSLIREIPKTKTTTIALIKTLYSDTDSNLSHINDLLCDFNHYNYVNKILVKKFQVDSMNINKKQRRIDLHWSNKNTDNWLLFNDREYNEYSYDSKIYIQNKDLQIGNIQNETAINCIHGFFILRNSSLHKYIYKILNIFVFINNIDDNYLFDQLLLALKDFYYYKSIDRNRIEEILENRIGGGSDRTIIKNLWQKIDKNELISEIINNSFVLFDTTFWNRRNL